MNSKNKKQIFKNCLIVFCLFVASFIIEILIFNFNVILLGDEEKGIQVVDDYLIKSDIDNSVDDLEVDEQTILRINLENIYVNKLILKYNVDEDVDVVINYIEEDYYGNDKKSTISDKLNDELNEQITNYHNNIKQVEYVFNTADSITIDKILIDNELKINFFRVSFIFCCFILAFILLVGYKKKNFNTFFHRYFIAFGFICGSLFIFLQPANTYMSWDDQIHFKNVLELFGGNINWNIGEFNMITGTPVGMRGSVNSIEEQLNQMEYYNSEIDPSFSTSTSRFITYNKVAYIPSAIGYHLCDKLGLPFSVCFKMGEVMNLVSYLLIFGYAIKISKAGKRLIAVLGLMPGSMFLACQYSYDAAVIAGIMLGIVVLLNWFTDEKSKVDFKSMFIFLFAILYASFPKAIYIPFILLFLFVPKEKFSDKKCMYVTKVLIVVLFVLVVSTFVSPSTLSSSSGDARGGATNTYEQLRLVINHPFGYAKILKSTFIDLFSNRMFDSIGNYAYFGKISENMIYLYIILFVFVAFTDVFSKNIKWFQKILLLLVSLGIMILIWTALYLSFTPVGEMVINGVQPRYFIPFLFPLAICFQTDKIKNKIDTHKYDFVLFAILIVILVVSTYKLILVPFCF